MQTMKSSSDGAFFLVLQLFDQVCHILKLVLLLVPEVAHIFDRLKHLSDPQVFVVHLNHVLLVPQHLVTEW